MKRILLLFLPFLPYLATAQVAKDTVTVLTLAQIPAGAIRDTTNLTFVQDNAFNKARFDSLARYVTSKLIGDRGDITVSGATGLTWELDAGVVDSMQLSAGAVVLPGAKVTGTLPVSKGGTGLTTFGGAGHIPYATSATAMTTNSNLTYNGSQLQTNKLILSDATTNYSQIVIENQLNGGARRGGLSVQAFDNLKNVGIFSLITANGLHNINFGGGVSDLYVPTRIWFHTDGYNKTGSSSTTLRVAIDSFGNMGLGTAFNDVISEKLHVVGNVRITGLANADNPVAVEVNDDGKLTRSSSYELKENIHDSPYGLQEVMALRPLVYTYKKKSYGEKRDLGFIAQDIESMIPEAVGTGPDSEIFLDRTKLIPILTKAIQQQQAQIEQLKQRITQLENK